MEHASLTKCNSIANKMQINLDVFCVMMLHRIRRQVGGADVVTVHNNGFGNRLMELGD